MILPPELLAAYRKKASFYNQTASKAEQIALCQFIRDGHLAAQTRRLKRLYASKLKQLRSAIRQVFGSVCQIQAGSAGTSLCSYPALRKKRGRIKKAGPFERPASADSKRNRIRGNGSDVLLFYGSTGFRSRM